MNVELSPSPETQPAQKSERDLYDVRHKRRIINRQAVTARLQTIGEGNPEDRTAVLVYLKDILMKGRQEIRQRFESGEIAGMQMARASSFLMDQIVRCLYDYGNNFVYPSPNPTTAEHLCLAAVGGYGRAELAPGSDVDLLFLMAYKKGPRVEQLVEYMLYLLWDLGLKVGHSVRSVDECLRQARADLTIRTSLLELRYLWGEPQLFHRLVQRYEAELVAGSANLFIDAKLQEREARHTKMGDSRYVLEPNIKDGKGGLRDLQTLFWIAKYVYRTQDVNTLVAAGVLTRSEARRLAKAANHLWTIRCHLHLLAGHPEERLTFDIQPEIARRMFYTAHRGTSAVERFMKHYYLAAKDIGDLTRIFCAAIEAEQQRRPRLSFAFLTSLMRRDLGPFTLDGERLTVVSDGVFADDPVNMLRLFRVAQQEAVDIHPHSLRLITRNLKRIDRRFRENPDANQLFLDILTDPAHNPQKTLRRMNEAGVLGRFIPDFGRVVAQTQHDMYHVYTVDEHTIFAIGILHRIERGQLKDDHPLGSRIISDILSRRALYVGLLCHDIAKGRSGDHSTLGAAVALKLAPRLGLDDEETETVAWLVRQHLIMSRTAFKRDLSDPKTIEDFAHLIQSVERLRLLLVLTIADIRAVGPTVWNAWKASLLRDLYYRTEEVLTGGVSDTARRPRIQSVQEALRQRLTDWSDEAFAAHCELGYAPYWLSVDLDSLERHAHLVRQAEEQNEALSFDIKVESNRDITAVTIYASDHPGLFWRITGAMALCGASIVDARVFTMTNGRALDTFWIQDIARTAFDTPERLIRLQETVRQVLTGEIALRREMENRHSPTLKAEAFEVPPRVLIDNKASTTYTLIEVNGRDRPGLLYDITQALSDMNLQVSSAKIATYGEKVVDVFYVKNVFGLKVEHPSKPAEIKEKLISVLGKKRVKRKKA